MMMMQQLLSRLWRDEEGQDLVEYALIVAAVGSGPDHDRESVDDGGGQPVFEHYARLGFDRRFGPIRALASTGHGQAAGIARDSSRANTRTACVFTRRTPRGGR